MTTPACEVCETPLPDGSTECPSCAGHIEAPVTPVKVGEVLDGKWRVERKLGVGGMATVVLARDLALKRPVAIKLLANHLGQDPSAVSRFDREARALAGLDHPNIVPVHAVGRHFGRPFIVMKYLEGMPLAEALKTWPRPLPLARVLTVMRPLCAALDHVHAQGLVHRDVKPANIFVGPDDHVHLLDFGILFDRAASGPLTRPGVLMGSIGHVSPEQLRGDEHLDKRADIYSLGAVLFEMLTGREPFIATEARSVAAMHLNAPAPIASKYERSVPKDVAEVAAIALSKRPAKRYASAGALLSALEEAVAEASSTDGVPSPRARRRRVRRMGAIAAGVAAVLAVAVTVATLRSTSGADDAGLDDDGGRRSDAGSFGKKRSANDSDDSTANGPLDDGGGRAAMTNSVGASGDPSDPAQRSVRASSGATVKGSDTASQRDANTGDGVAANSSRSASQREANTSDGVAANGSRSASQRDANTGGDGAANGSPSVSQRDGNAASGVVVANSALENPRGANPSASKDGIAAKDPRDDDAASGTRRADASGRSVSSRPDGAPPRTEPTRTVPSRRRDRSARPAQKAAPAQPAPTGSGTLGVVALFEGRVTWANLFVDGVANATTPVSLSLSAGSHVVRLERTGFRPVERRVQVKPEQRGTLRIELERTR